MGKKTSCSPPIINEEAIWGLMTEFLKGIKCNKMITFNQIHLHIIIGKNRVVKGSSGEITPS